MILDQGTWTPVIWDDTLSDAEAQTYSINVGEWQRLGNRILISGNIQPTSVGTLTVTEQTRIGGLPFVSSSTVDSEGGIICSYGSSLAVTVEDTVSGIINTNVSYISLNVWDTTAGPTILLISEYSAGGLKFHGQYITDD